MKFLYLYDKKFRKSIESLKGLSDSTNSKEQLNRLEEEIEIAHSEQNYRNAVQFTEGENFKFRTQG
jgi:hypothetical protein